MALKEALAKALAKASASGSKETPEPPQGLTGKPVGLKSIQE